MPVQTSHPISFPYSGIDHSYEMQENFMHDGLPSFQFRKRNGEINWRKLSALDVDKVARELDFVTLQENIATVTFCNIDAVCDVDPLIAKLFKLAQFTIEYLLHSQEYLQSIVNDYETKIEEGGKNNEALQAKISELNDDVAKLKEENKKRRRMIQQQQMLIEAGASSYYQCPYCEKAFMNVSFLQGHLQRRHPGSVCYIGDVIAHSQKEQSKLGQKMRLLEDELQTERETFNAKLNKAEEEKKRWTEESQRLMDEWKMKEEARMKEQMESMRVSFLEDVDNLKKKEETYQEKIADLQETMDIRHSNLGELVDDLEEEKQKLRDYEERVMSLEELNSAKSKQIEYLTKSMRKMRQDSSFRVEHDDRLIEQERKMRALESQLKSKSSVGRMEKIRKQVEEKTDYMDDESESVSDEGISRSDEINAMKPQIRMHLQALLDDRLRSSGVDPDASRISTALLTRKLMVLKAERKQTAEQIPDYFQIRESSRKSMVEDAKKKFLSRLSTRPARQTALGKSQLFHARSDVNANVPDNSSSHRMTQADSRVSQVPQQSSGPRSRRSPRSSSRVSRRKSSKGGSLPPSTSTTPKVSARKRPSHSSPSPSGRKLASQSSPVASRRKAPPSSPTPTPVPRTAQSKTKPSSPLTSDDDVSDWDDVDDILNDDEGDTRNKVTVVEPNVKNLAKKLEVNLSSRKKPPVGAVDVSPRMETKVEEFHLSDEEEDSFLVSSLEEEKKVQRPGSSRAPASGLRKSAASTSSNTFGTSVWGSGQKQTKSTHHDDFDSDDDLDIDELMT